MFVEVSRVYIVGVRIKGVSGGCVLINIARVKGCFVGKEQVGIEKGTLRVKGCWVSKYQGI